jgi:UDP-2,4-diacetamido-2,4,6-trideoxy-beta-L-altropyranose hydrolase
MKRILFRADAKPSIGTGDLASLIHLSAYFRQAGWQTHFMIRNNVAALRLAQRYQVSNLKVLEADCSLRDEIQEIDNYVDSQQIDLLLFEITERPLSDYIGLSTNVAKACVCFDGKILPDFSLVVDWGVDAPVRYDIDRYPKTHFLLGPEYVILPIEFNTHRIRERIQRKRPGRLLVAMGGGDEFDLTSRVVVTLSSHRVAQCVDVVIGAGYQWRDALARKLEDSRIDAHLHYNVNNMLDFYLSADAAVGAGGLTAFELVASRTPAVLIATYEHQIQRCRYFHSKGWARYLGFREYNEASLIESLVENPPNATSDPVFKQTEIVRACMALA